ncbi:Putative hydroxymethylpyrimidine/ phosphomethylpyrimidine kinase [Sparassis crispa]|uniref:Hydroxymethylpyrimidine/ phosphomethylpyrimidine kinase n=1 Tax=Sparassis crispa TaxID=139825 RepID=A0A401GKY7_9APHY|nr:Putative hydroxymethylpyrimidine/ phosphomethylpyrimidine kinase [Sparassis crispa]GBE82820.1 Putative hydroxymethylpyrimidine/ phosphomethylpyrimidine kinase [Sparassis crispa]
MASRTSQQPVVMTIAGSDPSGGAGIQADLKTFTALGCYGTSVLTALTAQNTTGVIDVHAPPHNFMYNQLVSVLEDIDIDAIKTGMLFDAGITRTVVRTLASHFHEKQMPPLVCDPVCVSTSGHKLLQPEAIEVIVSELFPLTALVTPNKTEASLLLTHCGLPSKVDDLTDMITAAKNLQSLGPKAVLIKGGHITVTLAEVEQLSIAQPEVRVVRQGLLGENMEILQSVERDLTTGPVVVDVLHHQGGTVLFVRPHVDSTSTHGTGCTLSAALACALAVDEDVVKATQTATMFTHLGIENAIPIGHGFGPLNHLHGITQRSVPKPTPSNPHPLTRALIESTGDIWKAYVQHEFVQQLARGTLSRACFLHFIKQDYLYLKYYARAYGLLVAKSSSFSQIDDATRTITNVINEVSTHRFFCAQWGISEAELSATPESPATTAYGAYILDVGLQGDSSRLVMAVAACLLGYGEVGLWIKRQAALPDTWVKLEGNPYLRWIEDYSGEQYQGAVKLGLETIEAIAVADPPSKRRFEEWQAVWERCTRLEKGFWDMSMGLL